MGYTVIPKDLDPQEVRHLVDRYVDTSDSDNMIVNGKNIGYRKKNREYQRELYAKHKQDAATKKAVIVKKGSTFLVDNNEEFMLPLQKQAALAKLAQLRLAVDYILRLREAANGMEKSAWGGRWAAARAQRAYARGNYARGNRLMQRAYRRGYPQQQYYYPQQPAAPVVSPVKSTLPDIDEDSFNEGANTKLNRISPQVAQQVEAAEQHYNTYMQGQQMAQQRAQQQRQQILNENQQAEQLMEQDNAAREQALRDRGYFTSAHYDFDFGE